MANKSSQVNVNVRVELYAGESTSLTFYIPTENGEAREQIDVVDQEWAKEVVEYVALRGEYKPVIRPSEDKFMYYVDNSWTVEVSAERLLRMIKASKSWTESEHARRIVQLLERGGGHG